MSDNESLLDSLTRMDDLLRQIKDELSNISPTINTDRMVVEQGVPRQSFQLEMSHHVPANDTATIEREAPFDGWVKGYVVGFPDGADQAVGVRLESGDDGSQYFPRNAQDKYFAANDFTTKFDVSFEVEKGDKIVTAYKNNDPQNPHFINSMVTIKRRGDNEVIANGT